MKKLNLISSAQAVKNLYFYNKIGKLNGNVLSVVNVKNRTFDFHIHENSDELFYVIKVGFFLETDEEKIRVEEGELIIVPKGVRHRPIVNEFLSFLLIELVGTLNREKQR